MGSFGVCARRHLCLRATRAEEDPADLMAGKYSATCVRSHPKASKHASTQAHVEGQQVPFPGSHQHLTAISDRSAVGYLLQAVSTNLLLSFGNSF